MSLTFGGPPKFYGMHFGLEPVSPDSESPDGRAGADGTRVNFFLVPVAEGRKALIELVENPAPKSRKR